MSHSRQNFWVGAFVLLGLGALGVMIVLFGQLPTWISSGNTYPINIRFETIAGVREGTVVTLAGKRIGRVSAVDFANLERIDLGVRVVVAVERQYRLPKNCRAVTSEAIFGVGRPPIEIVVDVPSAETLAPGAEITGHTISAVNSIFPMAVVDTFKTSATQIGEAAGALKPVLDDMHEILVQRRASQVDVPGGKAGNLSSAMERLDSSLRHLNEVLGDPETKGRLREAIENIHAMTEDGKAAASDLKQFASDAREVGTEFRALTQQAGRTLENMDKRIDNVARGLTDDLEKAGRILDVFSVAAGKIRRGEGTIGKLIGDDRLFESMVLTFRRFTEMVVEMKVLVKKWQEGKIKVAL